MAFSVIGILVLRIPLLLGALLIIFARRGGKGYPACGKCEYDVGGSVGTVARCPECGSPFTEAGILPPRGKGSPIMLAGGIVLVVLGRGYGGILLQALYGRNAESQRAAAQALSKAQQQRQQVTQADQQGAGDANIDEAAQPSAPER